RGQELRAPSIDAAAVRESILRRRGVGGAVSGADARRFAAQEDPGAVPRAPGVDGPPPASPVPPTGNGEAASAGEQAGLLKITEQGQVEPALVALEETAIEPSAEAEAPPSSPDGAGSGTDSGATEPGGAGA